MWWKYVPLKHLPLLQVISIPNSQEILDPIFQEILVPSLRVTFRVALVLILPVVLVPLLVVAPMMFQKWLMKQSLTPFLKKKTRAIAASEAKTIIDAADIWFQFKEEGKHWKQVHCWKSCLVIWIVAFQGLSTESFVNTAGLVLHCKMDTGPDNGKNKDCFNAKWNYWNSLPDPYEGFEASYPSRGKSDPILLCKLMT